MTTADAEVTEDDWAGLTVLESKRRHYALDAYFRQSFADARDVLRDDLFAVLHAAGLVVLKPEAIAGRRGPAVLSYLAKNAFTPFLARPFALGRHTVTELWRYQWNAATLDKMEVAGRVNADRPVVFMVVRDDAGDAGLPAAVRLKTLKGAAAPEARRDPASLRSVLASPNRLLTFVHAADEPADVVREIGVFFDRDERRALYAAVRDTIGEDASAEAAALVAGAEETAPAVDFDPAAAWERIAAGAGAGATRDELDRMRAAFDLDGSLDWRRFDTLTARAGAAEWDVLTVATAAVENDVASREQLVSFALGDAQRWLGRRAPHPHGSRRGRTT